jgi:hypothetical protein
MFMDHIFIYAEKMVAKHCIMDNVIHQILKKFCVSRGS